MGKAPFVDSGGGPQMADIVYTMPVILENIDLFVECEVYSRKND